MGINGLTKLLTENENETDPAITKIYLKDLLEYSRVVVDVNIYLYGFVYNSEKKRQNSHIDGFFQMISDLLKNKIIPVMIFDGKIPTAKDRTKAIRNDTKQTLRTKVSELTDEIDRLMNTLGTDPSADTEIKSQISQKQTEIDKYSSRDIVIQSSMYTDLKRLFDLMGIPHFQANGEADALCVKLFLTYPEVVGILSEDLDVLPLGGNLIRGIKEKRIPTVTRYDVKRILENLQIDHAQFIDLCILCGCDYAPKIRKIGPKTALAFIRQFKSIENILDHIRSPTNKVKYGQENIAEFAAAYQQARDVFLHSQESEPNITLQQLALTALNQEELFPYLETKCRYRPATLMRIAPALCARNVNNS